MRTLVILCCSKWYRMSSIKAGSPASTRAVTVVRVAQAGTVFPPVPDRPEAQVAGVMEETERLLIRFAAADPKDAGAELAGLRKRVESRDLLFRLQVMEAQIEKREQSIASSARRSL